MSEVFVWIKVRGEIKTRRIGNVLYVTVAFPPLAPPQAIKESENA